MKRTHVQVGIGGLLVIAGIALLLHTMGLMRFAWDLLWALLFAAGGVAFLTVFANDRGAWWSIIPGFTLLGLASAAGLQAMFPRFAAAWAGAIFLGAIGLSFWVVYLVSRENWWAIIPGGTLTTLALVAGLSEAGSSLEMGGLFFLGLAATFGLVFLLPGPESRRGWAVIPTLVLGIMGLLLVAAHGGLINYVWPLALIGGGTYLVLRKVTHPGHQL